MQKYKKVDTAAKAAATKTDTGSGRVNGRRTSLCLQLRPQHRRKSNGL